MASWCTSKTKRLIGALTIAVVGVLASGCGDEKPKGVAGGAAEPTQINPRDTCATPNSGCQCQEPARVVKCGQVQRQAGGQTWCSVGHRTCSTDNLWGDCEIEGLELLSASPGGQRAQSLGKITACTDNPCDPFCEQVVDTGSDLDLPDGLQESAEGGITLTSFGEGSINDDCRNIEVTPAAQAITVMSFGAASSATGLLGEYFDDVFDNDPVPGNAVPVATRTDPNVDFTWSSEPVAGVDGGFFSARWTGWLKPSVTQVYQLCMLSDDGVRVWLGDDPNPIIDHWNQHAPVTDCAAGFGPVLSADTLYKLRVEFFNDGGGARAQLSWRHPGAGGGEVIPSANLLPPDAASLNATFQVSPAPTQLVVHALPDGCFDGSIRAVWSVDALDRGRVDEQGNFTLLAPIAGTIKATASVGRFSAEAAVNVEVDVADTVGAPPGAAAAFSGAASGTDPMTVLYPYADTVFPLGLRAPTVQWDSGGTAADAIKISLRSPATGAASFSWSKVLPDSSLGRYGIPQDVWAAFEASAKGKSAAYSVQRRTGGVARPAVVRPITVASAPLRGKIYYTQYGRSGSTDMMVADPGSTGAATSVFASDAGGPAGRKCPVCHSVSADGSLFATSDRSNSANGGLARIGANGGFTLLSDYSASVSPYRDGAEDWRGFAWAPLSPDGKYALAANNFWGNTKQRVVGIDPTTRKVSVTGGSFLSGGSGTGLLAKYYSNTNFAGWDWRRTDAKIDFDWGAASPGGPVPTAFSVDWSGAVQPYTTEPYTFSVTTSAGVRLSVAGTQLFDQRTNSDVNTFSGTVALTRGVRVPIHLELADTAALASVSLSWATPTIPTQIVPQTQLYPNDGWHGLLATYYDQNDFTQPFITDRLESNLDADWGTGGPRPMPSTDDDNWSAVFRGQLQAPATGDLEVCAKSSDDVTVLVDGVVRIAPTGGAYDSCAPASFAVTEGQKYDLEVRFRELTADAQLSLGWSMSQAGRGLLPLEIVPSERLTPPVGWAPSHGLTAVYYDTDDFNATQPGGTPARAASRVEENADLDWGTGRPEFSSAITDSDTFTSRFTGRLEAQCAGIYEFEVTGDDGGRLWIDDLRVVHLWSNGMQRGARWLDQGMHDLKIDYREDTGFASLNLRWRAECMGVTSFTPIPNASLYPDGDVGTGGYVPAGGDNGNDSSYFVWQTPAMPGAPSVDVTDDSAGRWGLGATVMMVPSFAPDGSKLVFIDGDSAAGNGWRKGLSTFSFDQNAQVFRDRKTIVSTWPAGDALKWPTFESDSRSVIYQATVPGDVCCRKTTWKPYGFMAPTNYFEDPGRLFSVDTAAAAPVGVELANLNRGERALDRNKSYQATMLPEAAGGFRWAVFSSTRPYGNTLNLNGQQDFSNLANYTPIRDSSKLQSMLWVAAVDDSPSAGADRSHPAFFLPSQSFNESASSGFLNERPVWVAEACHPPGTDAASACDVDEDCCGGADGSAVCRVDAPLSPATRHCFQRPGAGSCAMPGEACASADDCCAGTVCSDGACIAPSGFASYSPANFERVYSSDCLPGQNVDWTFFDFKARVPTGGGALELYAESSDDPQGFQKLPPYPAKVELEGVALLGIQGAPGDLSMYTRITLDQPLSKASVVDRKYLKITIRFVPNEAGTVAPLLSDWRQSFSCPPSE